MRDIYEHTMSRGSTSLRDNNLPGNSDNPAQAKHRAAPGGQGGKAPINSDDSLT